MRTGRTQWVAVMWVVIGLSVMASVANAQPNLNFKRVTVNWPTVELYFGVGCNGNPAYNMTKKYFRIYENGIEVTDFTLWCPDPTVRCAISTALVFDASGSMGGSGNAGAKAAGRAFVDQMDGVYDEAAVIWFSSVVTIKQQMTSLKPLLYSAVDALPASGGTAVWDGIYAGIIELINNGINQCRMVIVLTDGGDASSTRTPAEIISLANRNRIRVFTIGLGSSINATELEMIALLTGGRYYQTPNAGQLPAIYKDIATIIFQSFQECVITYERDCADGGLRTVELQVDDFCGGTDVKTKAYRAPLDSMPYSPLVMRLGKVTTREQEDAWVPLHLVTPVNPAAVFHSLSFTIPSDSACGVLQYVRVPQGSLLDSAGVTADIIPVPGGFRVQTSGRAVVQGPGHLLDLKFRIPDVQDTTCCTLSAEDVQFEAGCFLPQIEDGELCVYPVNESPIMQCDLDFPSELTWQPETDTFLPDPFTITMRSFNVGSAFALNSRFHITYDTSVVRLISPQLETQAGNPVDVPPNEFTTATWQFAAVRAEQNRVARFTVFGMFDNHDTIDCAVQVEFGPVLQCDVSAPQIFYDPVGDTYSPMPFPVNLIVRNTGGRQAALSNGIIDIPPDLVLTSGSSASHLFLPSRIDPGQSTSVYWMLLHPLDTATRQYTVDFIIDTEDFDSLYCSGEVLIPSAGQSFDFDLSAGGPLQFCAGRTVTLDAGGGWMRYRWNTGEQTRLLQVDRSGIYFCSVTDSIGRTGVSDTLRVTVLPEPRPLLNVTGSNPMCPDDSLLLEAPTGYVSYTWNRGSTSRIEVAKSPGIYYVSVVDTNGCVGYSDTVQVTTWPAPSATIRRSSDSLYANDAAAWQWYRDGQQLASATQQGLALPGLGTYTVQVSDSNGCTAMSDPFDVTVLPVDELPVFVRGFDVYPNPSNGRFTLALTLDRPMAVGLHVSNMLGRDVHQREYPPTHAVRETLDFPEVPPGVYLLRVRIGPRTEITRRLLLQRK